MLFSTQDVPGRSAESRGSCEDVGGRFSGDSVDDIFDAFVALAGCQMRGVRDCGRHRSAVGKRAPAFFQIASFEDAQSLACCHIEDFTGFREGCLQAHAAASGVA